MTNLEDHVVEINGEKYVPLDAALQALAAVADYEKLDEASDKITEALKDITNAFTNIDLNEDSSRGTN